jgi:hypothetical protein
LRLWLLPSFFVFFGCATTAPKPVEWAAREDGVDIQVEMVTRAPSFAITVHNHARDAVSFAGAVITVEDEAGGTFRVYTDEVMVQPGDSWHGGLASTTPKALGHGRLGMVMRGVHVGARELEPQAFVFEDSLVAFCTKQ